MVLVSAPWVSTGVGTTVALLIDTSPLTETWLVYLFAYLDDGATITVDFGT